MRVGDVGNIEALHERRRARQPEGLPEFVQVGFRIDRARQSIATQKSPRLRRGAAQRGHEITQCRCLLEILAGGRRLHLLFQLFRHIFAPALEKFAGLENACPVIRLADLSNARCGAIFDDVIVAVTVVFFRRHTRTAGTQPVFALEDLEGGTKGSRVRVGPVIAGAIVFLEPYEGELGEWIVEVDFDLEKIFVVAKRNIVFRPVFLDQPTLEQHRLGVGADHVQGEIPHRVEQCARLEVGHPRARRSEIVGQPLAQVACLAHIDDPAEPVPHEVNPGLVRHLVQAGTEVGLVAGSRHRPAIIAPPAAPAILASDEQTANLRVVRLLPAAFITLLTAASARAQEALPPVRAEINLWQVMLSGGPVMIPLGILSVIAVMLILVYLFTMRRGAVVTKRYMATADALLRKRDYLGLLAISNRHREAVARVMQRTLDFVTQHPEATFADAREIAETEGTRQAAALNQRITYLADIGTIAPMLGLFGTVLGMIKSFSVVASDIVASRPIMLAEGVSEALVTTATGLVIGIPAMAAYSFFRGRTQSLIAELEAASTQLMALMSVAFTRK